MSRILLLLNDQRAREEFVTILNLEGHDVSAHAGGRTSINFIRNENPDLAIVDTSDGDELIKDILELFPKLSVICWMNERKAHMAIDLIKLGAIDCLCVPLRPAEVIGVTNHALGRPNTKFSGTRFVLPYFTVWQHRNLLSVIFGLIFLLFVLKSVFANKSVTVFDLSHKNPTGIALSGEDIWIADWYTQSIYSYRFDKKLKLADNYYFSNFGPMAITVDNKFLWSCGNDLVLRKHVIDDKLDIVNSYKMNEHSPSGIAVIGDYVWVSDSSARRITKYIIAQGLSYINSYESTLDTPVGLSWDGKNIWLADSKDSRVYVYQEDSKALKVIKVYKLPNIPALQLASICTKGKWLYAVYAGNPGKMYRYRISSLKELETKPAKK